MFSAGRNDLTITLIMSSLWVVAHAVATQHIALVLDGACGEEGVPDVGTGRGPVGNIQQDVVFELTAFHRVSAPYGESQVVADLRTDAPALILEDGQRVAFLEQFRFWTGGEEVAFVISAYNAIRCDEIEAVIPFPAFVYGHAARHRRVVVASKPLHPFYNLSGVVGRQVIDNEASGKGLGQHNQSVGTDIVK